MGACRIHQIGSKLGLAVAGVRRYSTERKNVVTIPVSAKTTCHLRHPMASPLPADHKCSAVTQKSEGTQVKYPETLIEAVDDSSYNSGPQSATSHPGCRPRYLEEGLRVCLWWSFRMMQKLV